MFTKKKEEAKPRVLILCMGRRETGLDLHAPMIAESLDLSIVESKAILQKAVSALSDGPSLETREKIKASVTKGELVEDSIVNQLFKELED